MNAVRCTLIVISAADNTADIISTSGNRALKCTILDFAQSHCIISSTDNTADVIHTFDGCFTHAVADRSLKSPRKSPDLALRSVISARDTLFVLRVFDCRNKSGAAPCKSIDTQVDCGP